VSTLLVSDVEPFCIHLLRKKLAIYEAILFLSLFNVFYLLFNSVCSNQAVSHSNIILAWTRSRILFLLWRPLILFITFEPLRFWGNPIGYWSSFLDFCVIWIISTRTKSRILAKFVLLLYILLLLFNEFLLQYLCFTVDENCLVLGMKFRDHENIFWWWKRAKAELTLSWRSEITVLVVHSCR
jgi:hypothetical protein